MRGALLLAFPLAFVSAGCSSGGACLLDSDCADFSMVCVERACVPPSAADGGRSDGGERDGGAVDPDSGPADAGPIGSDAGDAAVAPDGALPACADVTGAWRAMPADPASCGGVSEIPVNVTAGAVMCEFMLSVPLEGTFTVAMDGAVIGTIGGMACTGSVGDTFTLNCGACLFTLVR